MLIDRYVFREIAAPSLLGLLVYTMMFIVNHFFKLADQWVAGTLSTTDIAWALVYLLPSVLAMTLPMSALLGVLIGFSRLSADSELTALRTLGVSYYRMLYPTAALAILAWGACTLVYVTAVPWANTSYLEMARRAAARADLNREIRPGIWVPLAENQPGQDAAIFARGIDESSGEPWLVDVDILTIDRKKRVAEHHAAKRARITRVVTAEDTARIRFDFQDLRSIRWSPDDPKTEPQLTTATKGERLGPERRLPGSRSFATRRSIEKGAKSQSLDELRETLAELDLHDRADELEKSDPKAAALLRAGSTVPIVKNIRERIRRITRMEIHKKFAIPVACLVFAAAAMPLGIATRRGGRPASFVISIGVIMLWWVIYSWGEAWVLAGKLSPLVGAWLPNIVLGIVAANLLVGQRRQQVVGFYRAMRDGQLLGAMVFLVLGALLLYERLVTPAGPEGRPPYSLWVPVTGLACLAGHVTFVLLRDPISRWLGSVSEAFRRPRRQAAGGAAQAPPEGPVADEASTAGTAPRATAAGGRSGLEHVRSMVVFSLLALLVAATLQAGDHPDGLAEGLLDAVTGWQGALLLVLVLACALLQRAGLRVVSTLDAWVLSQYARSVLLVVASVYVLFIVFQYVDLAGQILQNDVAMSRVGELFLYLTPHFLVEYVPHAGMVAALVTFGLMTKSNETTALSCGGISIYRVVSPVVLTALLLSCAAFVLNDHVVPNSSETAQDLRREIQGAAPMKRGVTRGFLMAEDGNALYQFRSVVAQPEAQAGARSQVHGLTVLRQDGTGRVRDLYTANEATWDGRQWIVRGGWHAAISTDNEVDVVTLTEQAIPGLERPEYFAAVRREPDQMTFAEYGRYVEEQESAGYPTGGLRVRLMKKLASPAKGLVLVLVALPFAFTTGRRGALYGLGIGVILAVVFLLVEAFFTALGTAEYLPPVAAAWAPNGLFAVAGVYMLLRVRS